jgi:hypothetical protein
LTLTPSGRPLSTRQKIRFGGAFDPLLPVSGITAPLVAVSTLQLDRSGHPAKRAEHVWIVRAATSAIAERSSRVNSCGSRASYAIVTVSPDSRRIDAIRAVRAHQRDKPRGASHDADHRRERDRPHVPVFMCGAADVTRAASRPATSSPDRDGDSAERAAARAVSSWPRAEAAIVAGQVLA